jgi:hypothetical protein
MKSTIYHIGIGVYDDLDGPTVEARVERITERTNTRVPCYDFNTIHYPRHDLGIPRLTPSSIRRVLRAIAKMAGVDNG